jgi:hypothetical protein
VVLSQNPHADSNQKSPLNPTNFIIPFFFFYLSLFLTFSKFLTLYSL